MNKRDRDEYNSSLISPPPFRKPLLTTPAKENVAKEGEFIKNTIMLKDARFQDIRQRNAILASGRYHKCNAACPWENLDSGVVFVWEGIYYLTTGMVFVCKNTLNVHACGIGRCFDTMATPDGEGCVCAITGLWLSSEYSTANEWYEEDVRWAGDITYVHNAQHHVESKLAKMSELSGLNLQAEQEIEDDPDGFLANSLNFFKQTNTKLTHDQIEKKITTPSGRIKAKPGESFDDQLMIQSRGNNDDILRVMQRYPHALERELLVRVQERAKRRDAANEAWNNLTVSWKYILEAEKESRIASEKWHQLTAKYVKDCYERRIQWNPFRMLFLWLRYAAPSIKNTTHGEDIEKINKKYKDYYIECMLRIWELIEDVDVVRRQNILFKDCTTAILTKLSQGFTQTVYLLPGDPKPYLKDTFPRSKEAGATAVDIEFIPAHPQLVLASTSEVRKQIPGCSTSNSNKRSDTVAFVDGRKGSGCRSKTTKTRRTRQPAGFIPSVKSIHNIYANIIKNAKSMDDLHVRKFIDF